MHEQEYKTHENVVHQNWLNLRIQCFLSQFQALDSGHTTINILHNLKQNQRRRIRRKSLL